MHSYYVMLWGLNRAERLPCVKLVKILHQGGKGSGLLKQLFGEAAGAGHGQSAAGLRIIRPTTGLRRTIFVVENTHVSTYVLSVWSLCGNNLTLQPGPTITAGLSIIQASSCH